MTLFVKDILQDQRHCANQNVIILIPKEFLSTSDINDMSE